MNNRHRETRPLETLPDHEPWQSAVCGLLAQAAILAADHRVDLDAFMRGAWSAFIAAHPDLRAQLEELELRDQISTLRKLGRVDEA